MKTRNHRRHECPRNACSHPDIDLPAQLSLTLTNVVLRGTQLFEDQISVLIKTLTAFGQRHAFTAAHK
ncbi:hypothetical protein D3C85_1519460 [compost metagenome]